MQSVEPNRLQVHFNSVRVNLKGFELTETSCHTVEASHLEEVGFLFFLFFLAVFS